MDQEEKIYKKEEIVKSTEEAAKEIVYNLELDENENIMKYISHFNTEILRVQTENDIKYTGVYAKLKEIDKLVYFPYLERILNSKEISYSYEGKNYFTFTMSLENYILLEEQLNEEEYKKVVKETKKKKEKPFSRIRRLFR